MDTKKLPSSIYIYTIPDDIIEILMDMYIDYVTNPYSEMRQRHEYWDSRITMGIGTVTPIPAEYRALRYKYNPLMPNDEEPMVENLPKPRRNALRVHFVVLLDIIYKRCCMSKTGSQIFNASILQEAFRYYAYVIDVLREKLIIRGATYSGIEIVNPEMFTRKLCTNRQIIADIDAFQERAYKRWQGKMALAGKMSSNMFVERYNKCLSKYNLVDKDGAWKEINEVNCATEASVNYYRRAIENFDDIKRRKKKEFRGSLEDAPDINGRWYHLAVQTPSVLRQYTNIKYIVDARNSQLVLFNYFLLDYYIYKDISIYTTFSKFNTGTLCHHLKEYVDNIQKLDYALSHTSNSKRLDKIKIGLSTLSKDKLSNTISNNLQYKSHSKLFYIILNHIYNSNLYNTDTNHISYKRLQYDKQQLCNKLKINGFESEILQSVVSVPNDVLRYIYLSSHGVLWDRFAAKSGMSRDRVKGAAFGNIFYSYPHAPVPDAELRDAFRTEFRNVSKVLHYYKTLFAEECDADGLVKMKIGMKDYDGNMYRARGFVQLPHKLTQLESAIFYDILRELYKDDKVVALGIHDAIAVIDGVDSNAVIEIMQRIYKEYGLVASFKVE